ncbi:MAG: methyl-accepting chemotaxis protein [Geobacter sp.]|nr:MAG: methyl-accepting chemotaxis protein [Geobacter sp.]
MKKWSDLKVRTKLMVMVGIFCLALAVVASMGLKGMHSGNLSLDVSNQNLQQVACLGSMKSDFLAMRLDLVYMMALSDSIKLKEKWDDFSSKAEAVRTALQKFETDSKDRHSKDSIVLFKEGFEKYVINGTKLGKMLLEAHAANDETMLANAVTYGVEQVGPLYTKPAEIVAKLVADDIRVSQDVFNADKASYKRFFIATVIVVFLALATAIALGGFIAGSVVKPLVKVFENLKEMAAGDLSVRCNITSRDEMGMLSEELNIMADKLHGTISRVAHNGHEVAAAANQLQSTAEQMATGAEQAAAQTQTIATASEEMSATSSDIAFNCHKVASNADLVTEAAVTSSQIVCETISVMGQIAECVKQSATMVETLGNRSEEIGEIVGTIEDIADQTNLLALNAAIEAARAGDQGRGFAVVADEVRALAERTTKATKQIAATIKNIQAETRNAVIAMGEGVREVEKGSTDAAKSGEALQSILQQINDLSMQVNQIATAAEEQTTTTGEISSNIQQITAVVQMTANGSQESAAAATQLARLSEEMRTLMAHFKIAV